MRSNDIAFGIEAYSNRFWGDLERVRESMGLGDWEFSHYLGIKAHEYVRARRDRRGLPTRSVFRLTDHLPLSFDQFVRGEIDFDAISAHAHGNTAYLPEKYLIGARSKRRTTLNIIGYLEAFYGWREKYAVLRRFHMHVHAFRDPDALINVHFVSDLCTHLLANGYSARTLFEMGTYSTAMNREGPVGIALAQERDLPSLYERVVIGGLIGRFDENFDYRIQALSRDELVLKITFREEAQDALKVKRFGNSSICTMRDGVAAAMPAYIGHRQAQAVHVACLHRGDPACLVRLRFARDRLAG
jgi:hypothetical protein